MTKISTDNPIPSVPLGPTRPAAIKGTIPISLLLNGNRCSLKTLSQDDILVSTMGYRPDVEVGLLVGINQVEGASSADWGVDTGKLLGKGINPLFVDARITSRMMQQSAGALGGKARARTLADWQETGMVRVEQSTTQLNQTLVSTLLQLLVKPHVHTDLLRGLAGVPVLSEPERIQIKRGETLPFKKPDALATKIIKERPSVVDALFKHWHWMDVLTIPMRGAITPGKVTKLAFVRSASLVTMVKR